MDSTFFNNDIIIHNQAVKNVIYYYNFEKSFEIAECDLNFNILRHKENIRDFKTQISLELENFKILVEGHYEVSEKIKGENINDLIKFAGLATLIPFLRYSIFTITSTTQEKGIHLQLINLKGLIKKQIEKNKEAEKKR
jgi:preprotein translocase subunit SecB